MCGIIDEDKIVIDSDMRVVPWEYFPATPESQPFPKSLQAVRDHVLSKFLILHHKIRHELEIVLALAVDNMEIKMSRVSRSLHLHGQLHLKLRYPDALNCKNAVVHGGSVEGA